MRRRIAGGRNTYHSRVSSTPWHTGSTLFQTDQPTARPKQNQTQPPSTAATPTSTSTSTSTVRTIHLERSHRGGSRHGRANRRHSTTTTTTTNRSPAPGSWLAPETCATQPTRCDTAPLGGERHPKGCSAATTRPTHGTRRSWWKQRATRSSCGGQRGTGCATAGGRQRRGRGVLWTRLSLGQ